MRADLCLGLFLISMRRFSVLEGAIGNYHLCSFRMRRMNAYIIILLIIISILKLVPSFEIEDYQSIIQFNTKKQQNFRSQQPKRVKNSNKLQAYLLKDMGTSHTNRHDINIPNRKKRHPASSSVPHNTTNTFNQYQHEYNEKPKNYIQNQNLDNVNDGRNHKQQHRYKSKSLYYIGLRDEQRINTNGNPAANSLPYVQGIQLQNNMQQTPSKQYSDIQMIHSIIQPDESHKQNPVRPQGIDYGNRSRSESKLPHTYFSNNSNNLINNFNSNNIQPQAKFTNTHNNTVRYLSNNQNIKQYYNQYQLYKPVVEAKVDPGSQPKIIYIRSSDYKSDYNSPSSTSYSRPSTRQAGQPRSQQAGKELKDFYGISPSPQPLPNYMQVTSNPKPVSHNYYFPINTNYIYPNANNINYSYFHKDNTKGQPYWSNGARQANLGPYANQHGSIY